MIRNFDVSTLRVDDIDTLDDDEFRELVNADLRRNAKSLGGRSAVDPDVVRALRNEYLDRWYSTLLMMSASLQGQLQSRADEYESELALLRAELHTIDADTDANPGNRKAAVQARIEELRARYLSKRGGMMRFKTGLDEGLTEARLLKGVDKELEVRCRALETAIEKHRAALEADDIEPDDHDRDLWAVV